MVDDPRCAGLRSRPFHDDYALLRVRESIIGKWRIEVERPMSEAVEFAALLNLSNASIVVCIQWAYTF